MESDLTIQGDYEADSIRDALPGGADEAFIVRSIGTTMRAVTAADGATGRLLEVGAAEAVHACLLARAGFEAYALDPSPVMMRSARESMAKYDARVTLVRSVGERLPFADATFDRVLCDSAIDHFASPDLGVREMARVLRPGGKLILSAVNYAGLSVRLSRALYRVERALRPATRGQHRLWDSPVPSQHVFECTLPVLQAMCSQYLEPDRVFGLSLGWGVPGWAAFLRCLPAGGAERLLARLDRLVRAHPRHADVVVSVWRRSGDEPRVVPPARLRVGGDGASSPPPGPPIPLDDLQVTPADPVYQHKLRLEERYRHDFVIAHAGPATLAAWERLANLELTGDPQRSWLDGLIERGPFGDAAVLGCDGTMGLARWLRGRASARLDVYDLSPHQLDLAGAAAAETGPGGPRVRLVRTDLNFVRLPAASYDVVWSSGTLHHLYNLAHLFDEVAAALRPGGLFVVSDYVGERRHQYSDHRCAAVNRLLDEIPDVFHLEPTRRVMRVDPFLMSPFCGVRSDEILPLARERFEVVDERLVGRLAPLLLMLAMDRIEREAPELLARLRAAELDARHDPGLPPSGALMILRPRR